MLEFEKTVKSLEGDAVVHVFTDVEKGHTIYMSHTGTITVVEQEKGKNSKVRAAGFVAEGSGCSSCDGC